MRIENVTLLMQNFLDNNISADQFEEQYIEYHQRQNVASGDAATILFQLFTDVDAYSNDPQDAIVNPDEFIDETELRVRVREALNELQKLG